MSVRVFKIYNRIKTAAPGRTTSRVVSVHDDGEKSADGSTAERSASLVARWTTGGDRLLANSSVPGDSDIGSNWSLIRRIGFPRVFKHHSRQPHKSDEGMQPVEGVVSPNQNVFGIFKSKSVSYGTIFTYLVTTRGPSRWIDEGRLCLPKLEHRSLSRSLLSTRQ